MFLRFERAPFSDFQVFERDRSDVRADELQDFAVDRLDHPANLTVAALGDHDFEVGVLAGIADARYLGGAGWPVTELDTVAQLRESFIAQERGALQQISF